MDSKMKRVRLYTGFPSGVTKYSKPLSDVQAAKLAKSTRNAAAAFLGKGWEVAVEPVAKCACGALYDPETDMACHTSPNDPYFVGPDSSAAFL